MKLICKLFHWPWHRIIKIDKYYCERTGMFEYSAKQRCKICGQNRYIKYYE